MSKTEQELLEDLRQSLAGDGTVSEFIQAVLQTRAEIQKVVRANQSGSQGRPGVPRHPDKTPNVSWSDGRSGFGRAPSPSRSTGRLGIAYEKAPLHLPIGLSGPEEELMNSSEEEE